MEKGLGIVEVGSTVTKSYIYKGNKLVELIPKNIEFKKNHQLKLSIDDMDKKDLFSYINNIKNKVDYLYIYGTGFFRGLTKDEKIIFLTEFNNNINLEFNVLTPDEENTFTVLGSIANIDYDKNIAVMVSGGSSTEIAIVRNKGIIENLNLNLGVVDILNVFPDLANDIASSDINSVVSYIKNELKPLQNKADILVLAGGFHKMFRDMVGYEYNKDINFSDKEELNVMAKDKMLIKDEQYFYQIRLSDMSKKTPSMPKWWEGTRAVVTFTEALSEILEVKYIIPTNISAVYGIVEELKNKKK